MVFLLVFFVVNECWTIIKCWSSDPIDFLTNTNSKLHTNCDIDIRHTSIVIIWNELNWTMQFSYCFNKIVSFHWIFRIYDSFVCSSSTSYIFSYDTTNQSKWDLTSVFSPDIENGIPTRTQKRVGCKDDFYGSEKEENWTFLEYWFMHWKK